MQIIWAKSPQHAAEILKDLKMNVLDAKSNPDPDKAFSVGKVGSIDNIDEDENSSDDQSESNKDI